MKQLILGTSLGRLALSARGSFTCVMMAFSHPEAAGTIVNDFLAGDLTTKLCKPNKVFIDIGAHIGSVSASVAHYCPSVKIVAIEAIPAKAERIRRRFPRIEVHTCALSDAEGGASFFMHNKRSGRSSLTPPSKAADPDVTEIKVQLKRLDDVVAYRGVDVIKIDVEGAELGVLRGGERLVSESRPTIMFESGPEAEDGLGYTKDALWRWFADRDYALLIPNRLGHNDPGLSREGFIESHLYPRRTTNYFAVANERRVEVRDRVRDILKIEAT